MCVTGEVSEQLAELQDAPGRGPCLDAVTSSSPVLVSDLDDKDAVRGWPGFTPQARQIGAAAIFALPLQIGPSGLGRSACTGTNPARCARLSWVMR